MNNILLQLASVGQFCKRQFLQPCFHQLQFCITCCSAICHFFHFGRQESGGCNESSVCSSPVVYAPTEEFPHGSIEQNSLGDSIVSPCYSRSIKTKDRKPLLIEGKRSKEVEKKFFQKRDFPLPGSHQHEQVRNKLRKYIHKTFMKNEQVQCSDTDEKECVLCLDTFSPDNPKQLTLCACGENRTLFHYQCLIEWLEMHDHCPSCRSKLYYQESA